MSKKLPSHQWCCPWCGSEHKKFPFRCVINANRITPDRMMQNYLRDNKLIPTSDQIMVLLERILGKETYELILSEVSYASSSVMKE